jgi:phosphate transport system substrate-binding protein
MVNRGRWAWSVALVASLALVAGACGGDDDGSAESGSGGDAVEGTLNISGSSTVEPIARILGEDFMIENEGAEVNVDGPGTGDGFELFCNGDIEIADASRPIKAEEAAICEQNGVEYIELEVAFDGLTVITSPENDAVECLAPADLYALIGPESEGFDTWADADTLATEAGGTGGFPDAELKIFGPGQESGTYDSFIELATAPTAEARFEAGAITEDQVETIRSDYQASAQDSVIVQGVEGNATSLGWVGFAFAEEEGDKIAEIAVQNDEGECVAPSSETIADGSYPLSRSLYMYVSASAAEDNPVVAPFVDFAVANLTTAVEEALYVPLPEDRLAATEAVWTERTIAEAPAE